LYIRRSNVKRFVKSRKVLLSAAVAVLLLFSAVGAVFAQEPTWPDLTPNYYWCDVRVNVLEHDGSKASERVGRIELYIDHQTDDVIAETSGEEIVGPGAELLVWYVGSNYAGEPDETWDLYGLVGDYTRGFWGYSRPVVTLWGLSGELSGVAIRGRVYSDRSGNVVGVKCRISVVQVGTIGDPSDQHTSWEAVIKMRAAPLM